MDVERVMLVQIPSVYSLWIVKHIQGRVSQNADTISKLIIPHGTKNENAQKQWQVKMLYQMMIGILKDVEIRK